MTLKLVPTVQTKVTTPELIKGFVDGWIKAFNTVPSKESIGVLYAQNALESGETKFMWNYNIGNVKVKDEPGKIVEYMMLKGTWEIINGKKIIFEPPHPATWFMAFPTLVDGIAHHFSFLKNGRYKTAWAAIEAGQPAKFAHELKIKRILYSFRSRLY